MKRMLSILVLGLVLFGLSAGASWYLRRGESSGTDAGHGEKADKGKGKGDPFQFSDGGSRPSVRPAPTPTPENIVHLAASVQKQQDSLRNREQQLLTRQKHLELIYQDLKAERKAQDDLRLQIEEEMKALAEKMDSLERKSSDIDRQKQKITEQAKEIKQTLFEVDSVEQNRIKQMAAMYDTMEPESAAEILQHMADSGKMDTAVKILATMRERQAARLLGLMSDRGIVVQMMDRLKALKRPSAQ